MSTTTVTKLIPVTVRFDGCVCSEECEHFKIISHVGVMRCFGYACLQFRTESLGMENKRNEECCEMFGMGEDVKEQPEEMDEYELETMDAKDAEALRRWTSE